jgi:hypothetical protein
MTGYVRKDTTNNIADGNVINASDLDAEFDGVKDAFQASTGHKHDGTTGEGAPITSLGPNQDVTISATLLAPKTTNTVDIGSSALKFKDLFLAGNGSVGGTLAVTGVATLTANPVLSAGTANGVLYLNGSKVVTSGSALVFDGTNLGVGMTATAIAANYATLQLGGSVGGGIKLGTSSASAGYVAGTAGGIEIGTTGATSLSLFTNNATRATLDSSGNLGLGVTPSAWSSSFKALQVKNASLWSTGNDASLTANAYYDGTNYRYITTNGATRQYHNTDGSIAWSNAPSGTAGNAITFTQAMTLDASGRLGIGQTSPSTALSFADSAGTAGDPNKICLFAAAGTPTYGFGVSANQLNYVSGDSHVFFSRSGSTSTERARIDSSGNLLVQRTSPSSLGTNTKFTANVASLGGFSTSGTSAVSTNIPIDQSSSGGTCVFIASRNTSDAFNTESAVYILHFAFNGDNTPGVTYVGGSSNFVAFGKSGGFLTVQNSAGGNANYAWFGNK